jgi:hypothetical protein
MLCGKRFWLLNRSSIKFCCIYQVRTRSTRVKYIECSSLGIGLLALPTDLRLLPTNLRLYGTNTLNVSGEEKHLVIRVTPCVRFLTSTSLVSTQSRTYALSWTPSHRRQESDA